MDWIQSGYVTMLKTELLFGMAVFWILPPDKQPSGAQNGLSCPHLFIMALRLLSSSFQLSPLLLVQEVLISHLGKAFNPQVINYPRVTQPKSISASFFSTISLVVPPFASRNSFCKTFLGSFKIFDPNSNNNISSSKKRRVILPQS